MIFSSDLTLKNALLTLRKNLQLGPLIIEMESGGVTVNIMPGPYRSVSGTEFVGPLKYNLYINSKGDDAIAVAKWGVSGTKEENSIAHELGHVYCDYLKEGKKKPTPSGPPRVSISDWEGILSETMARKFDNYSRPPGIRVPIVDSGP